MVSAANGATKAAKGDAPTSKLSKNQFRRAKQKAKKVAEAESDNEPAQSVVSAHSNLCEITMLTNYASWWPGVC